MYLSTILESARQLCKAGYKVFPCVYQGKAPITSAEFGFTNGCHSATNDVNKLVAFIEKYGKPCNLGAHAENVLIVDPDKKHGGDKTLAKLVAMHDAIPMTPMAITGGGGRHIWFKKPLHVAIGNWTNNKTGIDTRTDGGYVIVPPSVHESGGEYEWMIGPDTPFTDCPPWLLDFIIANHKTAKKPDKAAPLDLLSFKFSDPEEDFITHPGEDKTAGGKQHPTLWKLIGKHLRRGDHYNTVKHLALEWGRRCVPPMSEADVMRHLDGLARKDGAKREAELPAALSVLPEAAVDGGDQADEDAVLSDDAYHGVLGDFVRAVAPQTEADPAAVLVSALVAIGNVIGNKPYFVADGDTHHTNLFVVCVGERGNARKGVSLKRALAILDDEYRNRNLVHGLSSGEGLINAVRDAVMKFDADTGQYQIVEEGVTDKRLLVTETEFAQALKAIKREGNTLSPIVRNAFDGLTLSALTKQHQKATGAHVSIVAHITATELEKTLSAAEALNGFANRFLWVKARRSKYLPDGGEHVELEPYRERVRHAIAKAQTVGEMRRSEEAKTLWRELYVNALNPDHPMLSRAAAITLRLSMIYALLDESETIEAVHLRAAYAVWQHAEKSVKEVFGSGETDAFEAKVYQAVIEAPGMSRKKLYDHFQRNVKMPKITDALLRLEAKGKLRREVDTATGGRPAERWHPTPERPNAETPKAPDPLPALGRKDVPASERSPPPSDVSALGRSDVRPPFQPLRVVSPPPSDKWLADYNDAQAQRIEAQKELERDQMDPEEFIARLRAM